MHVTSLLLLKTSILFIFVLSTSSTSSTTAATAAATDTTTTTITTSTSASTTTTNSTSSSTINNITPINLSTSTITTTTTHPFTITTTPSSPTTRKAPHICPGIHVRNDLKSFDALKGCTIIEGPLTIALVSNPKSPYEPKDYENITFPDLIEIKDYLLFFRVEGLSTLSKLFPNLAVIKGKKLFEDYAFIIYEMNKLQRIDLPKLSDIIHGSVRIENNPNLCYVSTVNWDGICKNSFKHFIKDNNKRCNNNCPNHCTPWTRLDRFVTEIQGDVKGFGAANNRTLFCWSSSRCHDACQLDDGSVVPRSSDGGCCSPQCAGGCYIENRSDMCYSCRFVQQNKTCVEACAQNLYEFKDQCITEESCIKKTNQVPPRDPLTCSEVEEKPNFKPLKPNAGERHGRCLESCHPGFEEDPDDKSKCKPCDKGKCRKVCTPKDSKEQGIYKITSVTQVREMSGCNVINGSLEISLKGGKNVLDELTKAFKDLEEIGGFLKITRAYPIITLGFLPKLRYINGTKTEWEGYSLLIFDNQNLQELFMFNTSDTNQKQLKILNGTIFVHLNPRLCPHRIERLKEYASVADWDERDVSIHTNGDKEICNTQKLNLRPHVIYPNIVGIQFDNYALQLDDPRSLLYYLINYRKVEDGMVTMYDGRDGCSSQNDLWKTVEESVVLPEPGKNATTQEVYLPAEPSTLYAIYVKTFTLTANSKGAISDILYIKSAPHTPGIPTEVVGESYGTDSVSVSWSPPSKPRGIIERYLIVIKKNTDTVEDIQQEQMDVCSLNTRNLLTASITSKEVNNTIMSTIAQQISSDEPTDKSQFCNKANLDPELEVEKITFQDKIIDMVYLKQCPLNTTKSSKKRRSIDYEYNSLSNDASSQTYASPSPQKNVPQIEKNIIRTEDATLETLHKPQPPLHPPQPPSSSTSSPTLATEIGPQTSNLIFDPRKTRFEVNITANSSLSQVKNNANNLRYQIQIKNLEHYTSYEVQIFACHIDYTKDKIFKLKKDYEKCGVAAIKSITTLPIYSADRVLQNTTSFIAANETLSENMVVWQNPEKPNGLIYGYRIRYRPKIGPQDVWTEGCINITNYNRDRGFNLTNVPPGFYIFGIQTITMVSENDKLWTEIEFEIPDNLWISPVALAVLIIFAVLILVSLVGTGTYYYQKKKHELIYASVNPDYEQYKPDEWEIDKNNLDIGAQIGTGSFGMVFSGKLSTAKGILDCAVKTIPATSTAKQRLDFLREASIMKQFDTHHVVKLMGVISSTTPVYVIMEFMVNGDLKSFLRSQREPHQKERKVLVDGIYLMAAQIADGMAYLASKKFVHRDLAARNCMVGENRVVKIGDFGLTRDIYVNDYYRKDTHGCLPVRWMAPESLSDNLYTSASDVWSYGIVVWEMVTFSAYPYQGQSNNEVIKRVISGFTMSRPDNCPDKLYNIMERCWRRNSSDRPTFNDIVEYLLPETDDKLYPNCFYKKETKIESDSIAQPGTVVSEEENNGSGTESYPLLPYPPNRANGLTNGITVNQAS